MAQSVLGCVTLGYRPLWNKARALAGIRLCVHEDPGDLAEGPHLLRTLAESWTAEAPALVLSVGSRELLARVLDCIDAQGPALEVPLHWLPEHGLRAQVRAARLRGARLLAAGPPQRAADQEAAPWFERRSVALSGLDAASALAAVARLRQAAAEGRIGARAPDSPVPANALVDGVASRALAEHALDQQGAWTVAGWPAEDVLQRWQGRPMPVSSQALVRVMNALDDEQSLDRIEQLFGREPTLAYRLLLYLNSAGLGLRNGVASLRHGFMMLGFSKLQGWLAEQLPHAVDDPNLRPINATMLLRGQLMNHLMDAGIEEDLRREVFLCGLFAQLDLVLDEPLRAGFARIPVSDRIVSAVVSRSGPYAPALEVALALEGDDPAPLRALRIRHEMDSEGVNRALLRTLVGQPA